MAGWELSGFGEAVSKLKRLEVKAPAVLEAEIYTGAEKIRTAAIRVTPKKIGNLRSSAGVRKVPHGAEIFYGGDAPYAMVVHEDMSAKNWSTAGTGPKFLETPFLKMGPGIMDRAFKKASQTP